MLSTERSPNWRPDSDRPDRQTEFGSEPNASLTGLWSWALYDWGNSAYWTVIQTFIFPLRRGRMPLDAQGAIGLESSNRCLHRMISVLQRAVFHQLR